MKTRVKTAIRNVAILLLTITSISISAHAEKVAISFDSTLMYQSLKQQFKTPQHFQLSNNLPSAFKAMSPHKGVKLVKELKHLGVMFVDVKNADQLEALKNQDGLHLMENEVIPAPPFISAGEAAETDHEGVPLEQPWGIHAIDADSAWDLSNYGDGVRVMVLDSGIDKNHPDLVDNFEAGKDFAGENKNSPYPYYDNTGGHGTHVAGTIAASGKHSALVGVAPKAKILAGRVCAEGCASFDVLSGLNWAMREKVDVVNLSLGGPFPSLSRTYKKLHEAGITVVAASGNDGRGHVSYPAGHPTTIAVGAVDFKYEKAEFSNWGKELDVMAPGVDVISTLPTGTGRKLVSTEITIESLISVGEPTSETLEHKALAFSGSGLDNVEDLELEYVGLGKEEDLEDIDLTGKAALIQRGEITFADKAKHAFSAGAEAVVIFNAGKEDDEKFDASKPISGTLGDFKTDKVVIGLSSEKGLEILEALKSKSSLATVSTNLIATDYQTFQGTSMASPHVAGVVALMIAANPNLEPDDIKKILKETSLELDGENSENQSGAGLVNAEAAVKAALVFEPSEDSDEDETPAEDEDEGNDWWDFLG